MTLKGIIIKGIGGLYTVVCNDVAYECVARGVFRIKGKTPLIGDFVEIEEKKDEPFKGTITEIYERKNELVRPRIANIDSVFIVTTIVYPNINEELLDKFIINSEFNNIEPILCFSKTDLICDEENKNFLDKLTNIYKNAGYKVVIISTKTGEGMEELKSMLKNKVSLFAGASGVGKSSIINKILNKEHMETGALSDKIGRGKHTTRHAELLKLFENSFLVDTPGFTSLEISHITKEELPYCFREFRPFLDTCKFRNCKHIHEPDCSIKLQLGDKISEYRYERYKKLID